MATMNILAVGQFPPHPGGAAISFFLLLDQLAQLGHRIRVVAPVQEAALAMAGDLSLYERRLTVERFPVPFFQVMAKISDTDDYFRIEREAITGIVTRMLRENRPDLMFVGRETYGMTAAPIAKAAGIPVLMRAAGATTIAIKNGALSPTLMQALIEGYRLADQIVTPAQHMAERIRGLGLTRVTVVPNAVNEAVFHDGPRNEDLARRIGIREGQRVIAHISNLAALKRAPDLLEAAPAVLRAHPDTAFLIVGDGAEYQRMRDRTAELGLGGKVIFTGWVPYSEVPEHIRLADIVVMPAEDETQARVYLETRSSGRVLVASDIPAAQEVVIHGETGHLFPCADIGALADCLNALLDDPASMTRLGQTARAQLGPHRLSSATASYTKLLEAMRKA